LFSFCVVVGCTYVFILLVSTNRLVEKADGCFVPVKILAGKIVSLMTYIVTSWVFNTKQCVCVC